jgi:ribosomal protein L30
MSASRSVVSTAPFVRVELVKSPIGQKPKTLGAVRALGLRRIGQSRIHKNDAALQGQLKRAGHLLRSSPIFSDRDYFADRAHLKTLPDHRSRRVRPDVVVSPKASEAPSQYETKTIGQTDDGPVELVLMPGVEGIKHFRFQVPGSPRFVGTQLTQRLARSSYRERITSASALFWDTQGGKPRLYENGDVWNEAWRLPAQPLDWELLRFEFGNIVFGIDTGSVPDDQSTMLNLIIDMRDSQTVETAVHVLEKVGYAQAAVVVDEVSH